MRRAILHIGNPRTGSTTIQHVLWHLRSDLAERGILYPDLTPRSMRHEPHLSHQHLGEALDRRRPAAEATELLDALSDALEATTADVAVISYEDFIQEKTAPRIAARLRAVVERHGFAMETILVVKPQAEHLNSVYSHRMQLMREKLVFNDFFPRYEAAAQFDYARLIEPWSAACEGRARAIPLRDSRSAAPLLCRFFEELGLLPRVADLLEVGNAGRVENRSPGPIGVEISRRLRWLRVPFRLKVRPRVMMRAIEAELGRRGLDAVPYKGMDASRRLRIGERHAAANDRLAAAMWGRPWAEVVAAEGEQPVNELAGRPIDPALEDVIQAVMQQICAESDVRPQAPWTAPLAELGADLADLARRRLRLSAWRVV